MQHSSRPPCFLLEKGNPLRIGQVGRLNRTTLISIDADVIVDPAYGNRFHNDYFLLSASLPFVDGIVLARDSVARPFGTGFGLATASVALFGCTDMPYSRQ
jgi:hypothetical protein